MTVIFNILKNLHLYVYLTSQFTLKFNNIIF